MCRERWFPMAASCSNASGMSDLWIFGYGSLIWNPGFEHAEAVPARVFGLHRSLCIYSWVHRGTRARPGLVLGLDRGGSCHGVAFRVNGAARDETLAYLRARELVTDVYVETEVAMTMRDGARTTALTYIADRRSQQYAGRLPIERQLALVRHGSGHSGPNVDYVVNTVAHLRVMGVRDQLLERLAAHLEDRR